MEVKAPIPGRQDDPGQARHEARDDPRDGHDPVGIDPVELDEAPALDRGTHLESQAREAQEDSEQNQHQDRDRDGRQVDPVDRSAQDREVHDVRVEERHDGRRCVQVLGPEDHRQQRWNADQQGEATHHLRRRVRIRDVTENETIEGKTHGRPQHHHRHEEGLETGPILELGEVGEDERRGVGLCAEGEVEDSRRLVGQDEADGHQRIGAAIGHAREREPEKLLHPSTRLPTPTLAPVPARRDQAGAGVPGGSGKTGSFFTLVESKQLNTFCPLLSAGTYLSPETLMYAVQ